MNSADGTPMASLATLSTPLSPKRPTFPLVTEPRNLCFSEAEKKSVRHLRIVNTMQAGRMAWRMLSNAPNLYLVNPNKGFVRAKEVVQVEVTLLDTSRYSTRQQFILQMKLADEEEVDRQEVWKRQQQPVSNLRVTTSLDQDPTKLEGFNSLSSSQNKNTTSPTTTAISPSSNSLRHEEFSDDICRLEADIQKALNEKAERMKQLTKAINDVKVLEQKLDRETNCLFESCRNHEKLVKEIETIKKNKEEEEKPPETQNQ